MIVCDSTTLIILLDLGRMELLGNLFDAVIVPPTVYAEITWRGSLSLPSWIQVREVESLDRLETFQLLLDRGESEAITLALDLDLPLIIDEKKGRKIAEAQDINIIGLLGVVFLNVRKGTLSREDAECFIDDALLHGYRISSSLIEAFFRKL